MSNYDDNPFADPFNDGSVTQATSEADKTTMDDYNPFDSNNSSAMMQPSNPPPPFDYGSGSTNNAPPVVPVESKTSIPGHEELLRRQEELERKAEELQRREEAIAQSAYNARENNWPPLPSWFPAKPCFYQDFSVDIPNEFQNTVKMLYYLWITYSAVLFLNFLVSLIIFVSGHNYGEQFGMSLLWMLMFTPCSVVCWYRPVYNAFRTDSSINFFLFFFIMFFQVMTSIVMTVGLEKSGFNGWISAFTMGTDLFGVGYRILGYIMAVIFTAFAALSAILLKRVHTLYRTTGASFEKAQAEFASGVMKNPMAQQAASQAASAAVQSTINNPPSRY